MRSRTAGQLFKFPVIVVAFFALLFIHILMYFLLSVSSIGSLGVSEGGIRGQYTDPFITAALSTYLRTPLPASLDASSESMPPEAAAYLKSHPELWKGRTYGEFLALLISGGEDPARIQQAFTSVTTLMFGSRPPARKLFLLYPNPGNPSLAIIVNLGADLENNFIPSESPGSSSSRTASATIPTLGSTPAILQLYVQPEASP